MGTYSDYEQRLLDQQSGAELDGHVMKRFCGAASCPGHDRQNDCCESAAAVLDAAESELPTLEEMRKHVSARTARVQAALTSNQYLELLGSLKAVCTCEGENKATEDHPLCLFCDARLQIEAMSRTIELLSKRPTQTETPAEHQHEWVPASTLGQETCVSCHCYRPAVKTT